MSRCYYYHIGEDLTESDIATPTAGLHVGKKPGGWSFSFRAYRIFYVKQSDNIYSSSGTEILFIMRMESRRDWQMYFDNMPGILVDEYGVVVPDAVDWLMNLQAPDEKQIRREQSPEMRGPTPWPTVYYSGCLKGQPNEWRDSEGFRFYDGYFG